MKKSNLKKSLFGIALSLLMVFSALPIKSYSSLFTASAAVESAYKKPETVDIKGNFETLTNDQPTSWTSKVEYDNNKDDDSTSYNGVISSSLLSWDSQYKKWLNDWIANWEKNHLYSDTQKEDIITALEADLAKFESPLSHDFSVDKASDFRVLMLDAGHTYNSTYHNGTDVTLAKANRNAYISYKSNDFKLEEYSFYKISVWVKVVGDDTKASILLGGDLEKDDFATITKSSTKTNVTYHLYTFTSGNAAQPTPFISTTPNGTASLTHNNIKYIYDSQEEVYVPDPTAPEYTDSIKDYTITFDRSETASFDDWQEYTMYISTERELSNINLTLSLGSETEKSSGRVYFDDVKVEKIQLIDFYKAQETTPRVKIYDNREIKTPEIANSRNYTVIEDFENASHSFSIKPNGEGKDPNKEGTNGVTLTPKAEEGTTKFSETFPDYDSDSVNEILVVNNTRSSAVTLQSDKIKISQFRYYRISLWAQTEVSDTSLNVTLHKVKTSSSEKDLNAKDSTSPYTESRNNETSSSISNYWVEYVFFVAGNALYDTEVYLTLEVSANTELFVDNLVIEQVRKEDYKNTKKTLLNLASSSTVVENVTNGKFLDYDSVELDQYSKPLPPASWSSTKKAPVFEYYSDINSKEYDKALIEADINITNDGKTITYDGKDFEQSTKDASIFNYKDGSEIKAKIVKKSNVVFNYKLAEGGYYNSAYDVALESDVVAGIVYSGTDPMISDEDFMNSLKISATSAESITFKSSTIKLQNASKVYSLNLNILTKASAKANLKIVNSDGDVYGEIDEITTNGDWQTYTFYIATGNKSREVQLEITYKNSTDVVYFANIKYEETSTTTSVDDNSKLNTTELRNKNIAIIDFSTENFVEHSANLNDDTFLFDTGLYEIEELEGKNQGIFGILDTSNPHSNYSGIEAKDDEVSPYVLVVKNGADESTKLKAVKTFMVNAESSSKIVITAKALGLTEDSTALVYFDTIDVTFEIKGSDYTEYTVYVDNSKSKESVTIGYTISLLDTEGTLIIDSINSAVENSLESIRNEYPDGDTDTVKFVTMDATEEENENAPDVEEEKEDENNTLEILLAIFSSLLLVAALIFAIVYTRIKTIRGPKKPRVRSKVKTTDDGEKGFI